MKRSSSIPRGRLTEGSRTSIFVERDGTMLTPPVEPRADPGILRAKLIDEGKADGSRSDASTIWRRVLRRQYRARTGAGASTGRSSRAIGKRNRRSVTGTSAEAPGPTFFMISGWCASSPPVSAP